MKKLALLAGLALVCYGNALSGSFHFDDAHAIQENPSIRSLHHFGRFFTDPGAFSILPQNQGYRPLLLVTYALTAAVTGVEPHAFIAVNLLVHILCAWMVFITVRQTLILIGRVENSDDISLTAAAIFAVHPLFSECVNYVSARSESLSSLLMLVALSCYLRARTNLRWLAPSVLAMAGALLTKPTVTIFPLMLVAFEAASARRSSLREIAPRFLTLTGVVVALGLLSARMTPALAIRAASDLTRTQYLRSELPAIWHYVRLFLLPTGQSGDPNYPVAQSFTQPNVVVAGIALLALIGFSIFGLARRRYTGFALAIAWFILCLFPASSIFPLAEIVNEHRPYLAAVALCVLAAAALVQGVPAGLKLAGAPAREASLTVSFGLLLPLAFLTIMRNSVWHNEESLWADVAAKSPESSRAQMNYGLSLMTEGRMREAEPHLREAVRLAPFYPYAHMNLGNFLMAQNNLPEGLAHIETAVNFAPNLFWTHYYRGLAAERLGESPGNRASRFAAATELSPSFADGWYHLSLARDAEGNVKGALDAASQAASLRGSYEDRFMLAYLLLKMGNAVAAKPVLERLHAEHPDDSRVNFNLDYLKKISK